MSDLTSEIPAAVPKRDSRGPTRHRWSLRRWTVLTALALAVLIGFGVGFLSRSTTHRSTTQQHVGFNTNVLVNPDFKSAVTNWGPFFFTSKLVWDSGNHGRAKMISIINGPSSINSESHTLPPGAARVSTSFRITTTADRTVQARVDFLNANGAELSHANGPTYLTTANVEKLIVMAAPIPPNAVRYRLVVVVVNARVGFGEVSYVKAAYLAVRS